MGRRRADVQLSIMQEKMWLRLFPAHVVELPKSAPDSAAIVNNHDDGTRSLAQVRFSGKKYALSIGGESRRLIIPEANS